MPQHKFIISSMLVLASCLIAAFIMTCCTSRQSLPTLPNSNPPLTQPPNTTTTTTTTVQQRSLLAEIWSEEDQKTLIAEIRRKLQPKSLLMNDETKVLEPHQFLHLHHMKTGGTSIDHLMKCARDRMTQVDFGDDNNSNSSWNHFSIHECARGQFHRCVGDSNDTCRPKIAQATSMSLCSALKWLKTLGWNDPERINAVTILRHPVERVWSMYRFETRLCYKCKNLTEIYDLIDTVGTPPGFDSLCMSQLQNHETANLLTSDWSEGAAAGASDDEIFAEAIHNLKKYFTLVGLTEDLTLTAQILGTVFPWFNKTVQGSKTRCSLPHDNSTPENNHCVITKRNDGTDRIISSHWELPSYPDEETRKAIEAHNQLDLRLYEAAIQYFQLQKQAYEANQNEGAFF